MRQDRRSSNFDGRGGAGIDMLVLHYTGMQSAEEALEKLCDPVAKVSAHYLVDEDGQVSSLVDEDQRAWHAGVSSWRGHTDINARSIGIEIVNPGHECGYRNFPAMQMQAVAALALAIVGRHPIPARNVVGHSDIAPTRKRDPGERFDWQGLAAAGIGLWPAVEAASAVAPGEVAPGEVAPGDVAAALSDIGYDVTDLPATVAAFQRRFRVSEISGTADDETRRVLGAMRTACGHSPE